MVKKSSRKSSNKKYHLHDDHNFVLIAGGGFLVILLMYMVTGGDFNLFSGRADKIEARSAVKMEKRVVIENNAVSPEALTVKRGTIVTWKNNDQVEHTIASDDGSFNTGNLNLGESGSVTFEKTGTYEYRDQFNPELRGSIVVE